MIIVIEIPSAMPLTSQREIMTEIGVLTLIKIMFEWNTSYISDKYL
jgi:hypothetical protein